MTCTQHVPEVAMSTVKFLALTVYEALCRVNVPMVT